MGVIPSKIRASLLSLLSRQNSTLVSICRVRVICGAILEQAIGHMLNLKVGSRSGPLLHNEAREVHFLICPASTRGLEADQHRDRPFIEL